MCNLSSIFKSVTGIVACCFLLACGSSKGVAPDRLYCIEGATSTKPDNKMAEYLARHLQARSDAKILVSEAKDAKDYYVSLHVADDFGGDYAIESNKNSCALYARDERIMTWLIYQFIKREGDTYGFRVDDLPPSILPERDTVYTFPFEYRDIYMPVNQNPDMTHVMGINSLEIDWAIWGHQMSRVLGSNGDSNYGYQNLNQELFARSGGITHPEQFCFSSDKLFDLTVQYILEQYGDGTEYPSRFTIGPNDNSVACECRECQAVGNVKHNATPAVTRFVERLAMRFPKHMFFIPGYSTTFSVPDHRLPDNVGVFLSAIDYPRAANNTDSPKAQAFFKRLDQWKEVTNTVYIWDYICNFDDYLTPYPILYVMQQRLREYRARGVKGIFLNGSGYYYSTLQEAYTFILADLLINPDVEIEPLIRRYFDDAMPNIGKYISDIFVIMEKLAWDRGKELPLYGGIEEAFNSYLTESVYRDMYSKYYTLESMPMTVRERTLFEKTGQIVSYSYLEACRLYGLKEGGYAIKTEKGWQVKPEVLAAVENLKKMFTEDEIYILTGNDRATMDQMDRVNEEGVYIADYDAECEAWLDYKTWNNDNIIDMPLTVHSADGTFTTDKLTDGVIGISQNYHWGWQIYPQSHLVIDLPAEKLRGATEIIMGFLNYERHRLAPPEEVELWADGNLVTTFHKESLTEWFDEGEKVVFRARISLPPVREAELRFMRSRSHTTFFGLDEIVVR